MSEARITETDLHAYVDGALDPERRAAVERYLAEHPDEAERVRPGTSRTRRWARSTPTLAMSRCRRGSTSIVLPARSRHRVRPAPGTAWRPRRFFCLAVGLAGGWIGRGYWAGPGAGQTTLVDEAVAAHSLYTREVVHPVEVRADQQAHLTAWLSKRLDRNLVLPDLRPLGFSLVGGRLLPAQGQPAAQLMYEDETGQRVTFLIVAASNGQESSLHYAQSGRPEIVPMDRRDHPLRARRQPGTRPAPRHRHARVRATRLKSPSCRALVIAACFARVPIPR